MTQITHNLARVKSRIVAASNAYGRDPDSIRLLAVSKTHTASAVAEAITHGQKHFGENFANEGANKQSQLERLGLEATWHFIGKIQSNKCRTIARHFDWVHSVDRQKIVHRLHHYRGAGHPLDVLVQVNLSNDPDRPGVQPDKLASLCEHIVQHSNLRLRGLMGMAPMMNDIDIQHQYFAKVASYFNRLRPKFSQMDHLSMGMSQDLEAAIANGATWVRVGTDIFGHRQSKRTQRSDRTRQSNEF